MIPCGKTVTRQLVRSAWAPRLGPVLGESASRTIEVAKPRQRRRWMPRSPQTYGWEDFKPRETDDGTPAGRQLASYDGEIRVGVRRRSAGEYEDWIFLTVRQRNGLWTR